MENLKYVLRFALDVIEKNELEFTKNKDNWILGDAIKEQLNILVFNDKEVSFNDFTKAFDEELKNK